MYTFPWLISEHFRSSLWPTALESLAIPGQLTLQLHFPYRLYHRSKFFSFISPSKLFVPVVLLSQLFFPTGCHYTFVSNFIYGISEFSLPHDYRLVITVFLLVTMRKQTCFQLSNSDSDIIQFYNHRSKQSVNVLLLHCTACKK